MDKKYRLCYEWRSVLKLVWRRKEKEKKTAMFVELSSCVWSIICQCRFSLEGGFVEAFMAPRAWGGARKQLERILRMEGLYEVVSRTDARDESFLRWSPQRIESSWHQCLGCSICRWWLKSGSCGRLIGEDRLVWGSGCPSSFAAGLLASFQNIFGVKGSVVPHGNIPSILLQIEQHVHNLSLMWVTQCISLSRFSHPPVHRFQSLSAAPVCVIQLLYTKARRSFAFTPPAGEKWMERFYIGKCLPFLLVRTLSPYERLGGCRVGRVSSTPATQWRTRLLHELWLW